IIYSSAAATAASSFSAASSSVSVCSTATALISQIIPSVPPVAHVTLSTNKIRIQISLRQHFSLADPYFHANLSVNGQCEYISVVDIHPERMQRRTTLFDFF